MNNPITLGKLKNDLALEKNIIIVILKIKKR